jgi:hypothetical protein
MKKPSCRNWKAVFPEITVCYEEVADTLTEEEKEGDFYADDSFGRQRSYEEPE